MSGEGNGHKGIGLTCTNEDQATAAINVLRCDKRSISVDKWGEAIYTSEDGVHEQDQGMQVRVMLWVSAGDCGRQVVCALEE